MNDIDRFVQAFGSPGGPSVSVRNYQVTVVSAGAARDGLAQVSILVGTTNLAVPYLKDAYPTPTVGDVVSVLFTAGSPLILGRVGGLPTF